MLGDFVRVEGEGGVFVAEEADLGLRPVLVFGEEAVLVVWVVGVEFRFVGREEVGVAVFLGVHSIFQDVMNFSSK